MSTTSGIIAVGTEDSWNNVFHNKNTNWNHANEIMFGKDGKFGVAHTAFLKFSNVGTIPAKARISRCQLKMKAQSADTDDFSTTLHIMKRDGVWDAASRSGWSSTGHHAFRVRLEDGTPTILVENLAVSPTQVAWALLDVVTPLRRGQLGQSVTITTAGTLITGSWSLRRVGTIPGTNNLFLQIYSSNPDDTPNALLATSDIINASSVSTSGLYPLQAFPFSGGNQISLVLGIKYVVVLRGTYARSTVNHIAGSVLTASFPDPYVGHKALANGTGEVFDDQNYMSDGELGGLITSFLFGGVDWDPPDFAINDIIASANFRASLQEWVNDPTYVTDGVIGVAIQTNVATIGEQRSFYSHENAATPKTTLEIDWHRGSTLLAMGVG